MVITIILAIRGPRSLTAATKDDLVFVQLLTEVRAFTVGISNRYVRERSLHPAFAGDLLRSQRCTPSGPQGQPPLAGRQSTPVDPLAPRKILNVASRTHCHDRNLYVEARQAALSTMRALRYTARGRWPLA